MRCVAIIIIIYLRFSRLNERGATTQTNNV
jgi:hypothetical protein